MIRIGQGFDLHALVPGCPLILGGVTIPFEKGLDGHSDADAVLHAVTDALLGALALGDIGQWFSDTDPKYKNQDSRFFLERVYAAVLERQYQLENLDLTIICQAPKLAPWILKIRESLAKILKVSVDQISVKAKTHEKLDAIGRGEALSVWAVCLVKKD